MAPYSNLANLAQRHGWWAVLLSLPITLARKVTGVNLCVITTTDNSASYSCPEPYTMQVLTPNEQSRVAVLAEFQRQHAPEFATGAYAVVTLCEEQVAGYNFYATHHTLVEPGLCFEFPDHLMYSYNAFTHQNHRGKGLAPARWTHFRQWRTQNQRSGPTVSYIALDNLASMQSGKADDGQRIGYSAYRIDRKRGQIWCFRSANARRLGVGFARTPP